MARRVERDLADLAALFDGAAMSEPYGEEMSIRDHMLQCAELAVARRTGEPLVIAALLHDIGWAMGDAAHERLAADHVEPLFGAGVAEPIRRHVAAKRYLVAIDPAYHDLLSAASRRTLARQGGPMSGAERAAFAAGPAGAQALALRRLDDAGKDAGGAATGFADYIPLLRRHMIAHRLAQRG